jgi:hypothetical protein
MQGKVLFSSGFLYHFGALHFCDTDLFCIADLLLRWNLFMHFFSFSSDFFLVLYLDQLLLRSALLQQGKSSPSSVRHLYVLLTEP